jgi:hypothetical protein
MSRVYFPSSPSEGQVFSSSGKNWIWGNGVWRNVYYDISTNDISIPALNKVSALGIIDDSTFIWLDASAKSVKSFIAKNTEAIYRHDNSIGYLTTYIDGSLSFRDTSINNLYVNLLITDTSLSTLTSIVSIHDSSIGYLTTYIDGSLSSVDASIDDLYSTKLNNTDDTFTGKLIVDGSIYVSETVDVSGRISSYANVTGQSTINAGLVVNNSGSGGNIYDFRVNTDNYRAIDVSTINDAITVMSSALGKIGFFGAAPSVQSTGWDASQYTETKSIVANNTNLNELAALVSTLIIELKSKGIIG